MKDTDAEMHTAIRGALSADATRAPELAATWSGLEPYPAHAAGRGRSGWHRAAVIGLAAAAVGGAIALRSTSSESTVRTASTFVPPGVEYPLTDLGPATQALTVTTSGLSRRLLVNGHDTVMVSRTMVGVLGTPTASEAICTQFASMQGCATDTGDGPLPEVFSLGAGDAMTSSDGVTWDVIPTFRGTVWKQVPTGTAFVTYGAGSQQFWQRPVAGLAVFPESAATFVAYANDGRELSRVEFPLAASGLNASPQRVYDYSDDEVAELRELTEWSMEDCLVAHGGVIAAGSRVAVFDAATDQVPIWDACVIDTKRVVGDRVTAMNVHSYDASLDPRAQAPRDPLLNGDPPLASATPG